MKHDIEQRSAADVKATNAEATNPQPVRIMGFVDGDVIPPACYDEPYCLRPGKDEDKAYEVLREVMHRTRKVGLAAVVIEKKQALAAVIPIGRNLVLNVLRFATALVPGAKRVMQKSTTSSAEATSARPRAVTALGQSNANRRRAPHLTLSEAPKPAARMVPSRKHGEVIDLAVRRSSKRAAQGRADPRTKSTRTRGANVATLHQLRRKNSGRRTPEIQLA